MDSANKYGSDGVPFTGKIAEIKPIEQQLQKMADAFVPVIRSIIDAIVPMIEPCIDAITQTYDEILKLYPDKQIVWLAFNHKKAKVRKKNQNRIIKAFAKAVKRCDHG